MKHIKDFIYNFNDIIIIILILLGAAGLIYWRVNEIRDYPTQLAMEIQETGTAEGLDIDMAELEAEMAAAEEERAKEEAEALAAAEKDAKEKEEAEKKEAEEKEKAEAIKEESAAIASGEKKPGEEDADKDADSDADGDSGAASGPADNDIWEGGKLKADVSVHTTSGSAYDAVDSLVAVGLFESYEDFSAVCAANGLEPTDIKTSDYTFPAGWTQADIAAEVTKPAE